MATIIRDLCGVALLILGGKAMDLGFRVLPADSRKDVGERVIASLKVDGITVRCDEER